MEIREALAYGREKLLDIEYANEVFEAREILKYVLEKDTLYILLNPKEIISEENVLKFKSIIDLRLSGYPLQYILKEAEFMGILFFIEEGVLIPRQDTEVLVEYLDKYIKENRSREILELGLGSGIISLSLAYFNKDLNVTGVDIEDQPIRVSSINKKRLNLENVKILKGDLFDPICDEYLNSFDIVVSNPPYISEVDLNDLQREVKIFEPKEALVGEEEGLYFYKRISEEAYKYLKNKGLLIFEIGHNQAQDVEDIMTSKGYEDIEIIKDLQGLDRVILGFKNRGS